jgi:glycosyltransferase involved in cell wall biosynthesis
MVLTDEQFRTFNPGKDNQANIIPKLCLEDLTPKSDATPKLSYLISTWNRKGQLERSLECLARQHTKEFEILLMDDGSTENIKESYNKFEPFLDIHYYRRERDEWRSCPSTSWKIMLPDVRGKVVAVLHPEMMLHSCATDYLYNAHFFEFNDVNYHIIIDPGIPDLFEEITPDFINHRFWVSLKPQFVIDTQYPLMDNYDWHNDIDNLKLLPGFDGIIGFAGQPNSWNVSRKYYPWWFVASAKTSDKIWEDMPPFKGHAMIDMWFINYRKKHKMVDVVPNKTLCYHQAHITSAYAPTSESPEIK